MARKEQRTVAGQKASPRTPADVAPVEGPLRVARGLGVVLAAIGVIMFLLGAAVALGKVTEGWGFPMSAVPNWGRPWGLVLMLGGGAYVVGPAMLLLRSDRGAVLMMVISGLSVVLGTPLITTTTEIVYNLFQETKSRPDWVDSIWAYFTMLQVGMCVALYRGFPLAEREAKPAGH